MNKLIWLLLSSFAIGIQAAPDIQTPEGRSLERARIDSVRAALEKKFNSADFECQTRFVVTSCRDEVKVQRTRQLDELTREENILSAMERKDTAAKQQQKLDDKTSPASLLDKERKREEALESNARKAADREEKLLEKDRKSVSDKAASKAESKAASKPLSKTEQEKADKRAAYEAKQQEYLKRLKRRDEGLYELAEKQREREREEARKAEKYAKALEAEAKAKAEKP